MKKRYLIYLLIIGVFITACDPNEDLYEKLDKADGPYSEQHNYTLQESDYTLISEIALANAETKQDSILASSVGANKAFTNEAIAAYFVPNYIADRFIALKGGSEFDITYDYTFDDSIKNENLKVITDTFSSQNSADSYIEEQVEILDSLNEYTEDDFLVFNFTMENDDTTYSDTINLYVYYGGIWQKQNYYEVTEEDYDAMLGSDGSGPGEYGNFSDDFPSENYLPQLLEMKYPYAINGDKYYVKYNYYNSGNNYEMFSRYRYDNGWTNYSQKTEKFLHNGSEWVFSPIFKITMKEEDYKVIVEYIKNHEELSDYMDPQYDNSEYYYGATYYYNNFDMRVSNRKENDPHGLLDGLSDEEILNVMWERVYEALDIMLETQYPDAQPEINGAQVYYQVTFQTWEPGDYFYFATYKVTDVGEFELFQEKVEL